MDSSVCTIFTNGELLRERHNIHRRRPGLAEKAYRRLRLCQDAGIPTGRLSARHDCTLSDEDARHIVEFRAKYTEKPDYPRIIHQTMFSSIAYPCVAEGCPAGMVQVHLRANGDVCPCDFTPYSFGNIRKQPLKEIWESMSTHPLYAEPSARCRLS